MSRVLVTGANGFVGRVLSRALRDAGHTVTGLVRRPGQIERGIGEWVDASVDFAGTSENWPATLNVDCVVHLAARVHVMREAVADPDAAFRATNVDGTLRVAHAAWRHGSRRFVFVSSVKALADTDGGCPLREDGAAMPSDAYGRSKLAAEQALWRFGEETGMEIVVVRPPLVYGSQVCANFLHLMDAIWKGWPLPLASLDARRSLVYVENLADALMRCATDLRAANQCFHVADDNPPTVAELARSLGRHLNKPARLLPVPAGALLFAGRLAGRRAYVDRLVGSLRLDAARIRAVLDWQAPYSTDEGLATTANWYRSTH
jgi:UDP-glucose 4-epimerase